MTMLDRMRRHRDWLKWSLGLVCVAFVLFYIPDFLRGSGADAASSDTIAKVEGHEIRSGEFRRTYQAQLQAYRSAYGGNMNEQLLKQLGVERQILQQMVDERAALAEAERLGISVSDEEVRQRIFAMPAFQDNGAFIGETRYQQLLRMQRPPLTPSEFEDNVRRSLAVEKLRASLTDWLSVPDKELEREYRRRNDKVKLALVSFTADSFRTKVTATDAEVASYCDAHKNDFKIPEKRKIRYLLIDIDGLRAKVVVPPADIEREYNNNSEQYTTPEQVRASHILLKTDGKDDAAVKAKAEELLKQAKAGADFADLAKKNSEDDASAKNGGDLDYFGEGRMVPEVDAAVFAMQPGRISDLVKTQYGYHIIKLVDKKAATTRPLTEVRQQLTDQLSYQRAQAQAAEIAARLKAASDFEKAAKAAGVEAKTTDLITQDAPIPDLGVAPAVSDTAFKLAAGGVSDPIATDNGTAVVKVLEKKEVMPAEWTSSKDRFREELLTERRNRFFSAYMVKAKQKMKIEVNRESLQRAVS